MNQTWRTIVIVVITVIIVGGGVYYWQKNKSQPNSNSISQPSTEEVKVKSIDDYVSNEIRIITETPYSQLQQLVKVFSLGNISLLSDAEWGDGKDHEFYFELSPGGPSVYYGPFKDNVLRLKQEASLKENSNK